MRWLILLLIFNLAEPVWAKTDPDTIIPEALVVADKATVLYGNGFPENYTRVIMSDANIALYYASIKVLNPSKENYNVKIQCQDRKGATVIEGKYKLPLSLTKSETLGEDSINYIETTLGLYPQPGKRVPGQRMALKNEETYFVKLWVEGKLVGLTSFRYAIAGKKR